MTVNIRHENTADSASSIPYRTQVESSPKNQATRKTQQGERKSDKKTLYNPLYRNESTTEAKAQGSLVDLNSVKAFINFIKDLVLDKGTMGNCSTNNEKSKHPEWSKPNQSELEKNVDCLDENEISLDECTQSETDEVSNEKSTLEKVFTKLLRPDEDGNISEGQAMHGTVVSLLRDSEGPALTKMYRAGYRKLRKQGLNPEQALHGSLTQLVKAGKLERADARSILGTAQRAAQLDNNTEKVSNRQNMTVEDALKQVSSQLEAIQTGELDAADVRLKRKYANDVQTSTTPTNNDFSNGLLWKPASESDGKLVVLLPASLRGSVKSASIHSAIPATSSNMIEQGRFAGDESNGNRPHFRFSNSGTSYPSNTYLVATLNDGTTLTQLIADPGNRFEK